MRAGGSTRQRSFGLAVGLGLGCLTACASPSSVAVDPAAEPVVYYTSQNPETTRSELEYEGTGGAKLGYIAHQGPGGDTAIVYLHGIESHGGWFDAAGDGLCARGYDVYCLDRRGSGINRENRGFTSGYVDEYQTLVEDVRRFMTPLHERYEHVFLVGLSWGGKLATTYTLTHPEDVDGLVLITPGLVAEVDLGFFEKVGVLFCNVTWSKAQFRTPIEPEMFTTTPEYLQKIEADPLKLERASARFFWQNRPMDKLIRNELPANEVPILLFLADGDTIIDNDAVVELLGTGGQGVFEVLHYEDQTHSIQFDATDRLVADTARWIAARLDRQEVE